MVEPNSVSVRDHRPEGVNRNPSDSRQCCGCHRQATITHALPSGRIAYVCDSCFAARPRPAIYFVRSNGLVKIGYSKHVAQRVRALRTGSSVPLELWFSFDGTRELEKELHWRFRRDRSHGEWFHLSPAILEYASPFAGLTSNTCEKAGLV
jgi:hypothetical protein